MKTGFHFSDFTPDEELKFQADQALEKALMKNIGGIDVLTVQKQHPSFCM